MTGTSRWVYDAVAWGSHLCPCCVDTQRCWQCRVAETKYLVPIFWGTKMLLRVELSGRKSGIDYTMTMEKIPEGGALYLQVGWINPYLLLLQVTKGSFHEQSVTLNCILHICWQSQMFKGAIKNQNKKIFHMVSPRINNTLEQRILQLIMSNNKHRDTIHRVVGGLKIGMRKWKQEKRCKKSCFTLTHNPNVADKDGHTR